MFTAGSLISMQSSPSGAKEVWSWFGTFMAEKQHPLYP